MSNVALILTSMHLEQTKASNYTLMKISGGSFEAQATEMSLRSMVDAQLLMGARAAKPSHSIFASLISSRLAASHASVLNAPAAARAHTHGSREGKRIGTRRKETRVEILSIWQVFFTTSPK